ncbi:hypothetical protein Slin14017_G053910 [Septoria linicola]|nr:hypothetical protein Slin14017_G053910 [Septoria linicola]
MSFGYRENFMGYSTYADYDSDEDSDDEVDIICSPRPRARSCQDQCTGGAEEEDEY